jgi:hypothetical protein
MGFSRFNSSFMVANQILIMMGIKFLSILQPYSFQNLLKNRDEKRVSYLNFLVFSTLFLILFLVFSFFVML